MMTDINGLKDLAQDVKIVLMSATISEDLNRGVARLEKRLMNKSVHAYDDELGVDGDNNEDNTGDSNYKLDEEVEIGQSVGISYWKKEMDKVKIQDKNDESRATNNKYYNPIFFKKLLTWYLPTFPLWTRIVTSQCITNFKSLDKYKKLDGNVNTIAIECKTNVYA